MGGCNCSREKEHKDFPAEERQRLLAEKYRPVYVHVYDLTLMNYTTQRVGVGIYHTGVEVDNWEYSYSGFEQESPGIRKEPPKVCKFIPDAVWKEAVLVGYTNVSASELKTLVGKMEQEPNYAGPSYNVLTNNCNHFSNAFLSRILTKPLRNRNGDYLPSYVNRVQRAAHRVRPCMPGFVTKTMRTQRQEREQQEKEQEERERLAHESGA